MKTPYIGSKRTSVGGPAAQTGLSLIELMVSITIGLVIIASLVGVLASGSDSSRTNDRTSEMSTNGRYALSALKEELRQTGFRGYTWALPSTPSPWVDPGSGCADAGSTVGTFIVNIAQPIWGADNSNPFSGSSNCIPTANYLAGTDVMVLRRLASVPVTTLAANTVYFQSAYSQGQMFRSTSVPVAPSFTGGALPVASFPLMTYVYFISPFTTTAAESPLVPALWRLALQADGTMARELVASGIERMQVQYGILSTAPDVQFYDTIAGSASETTPTNPAVNWSNVKSVRIWLLARNATQEPGYTNTQTYAMGNQSYTVNDGFRRQLYTTVVQMRN
jgi:type IV pilus assembly protein PilW